MDILKLFGNFRRAGFAFAIEDLGHYFRTWEIEHYKISTIKEIYEEAQLC